MRASVPESSEEIARISALRATNFLRRERLPAVPGGPAAGYEKSATCMSHFFSAARSSAGLRPGVRPRDGVWRCRLYIIMYSRAAESKGPWRTVPRHACHSPLPPETRAEKPAHTGRRFAKRGWSRDIHVARRFAEGVAHTGCRFIKTALRHACRAARPRCGQSPVFRLGAAIIRLSAGRKAALARAFRKTVGRALGRFVQAETIFTAPRSCGSFPPK